jgi:DNA-binding response OmpR family regulator
MAAPALTLLDDDDDLRESVSTVFSVLGVECLALSSVAALKEARETVLACRLVILDVNLGDGLPSGVDAYRWLREEHFAGRVIFLTGHAPSHPLVAHASAIGERILKKPIATAELRALAGSVGEE